MIICMEILQFKNIIPLIPAPPCLDICHIKQFLQSVFIDALFTIDKLSSLTECVSTEEWTYTYTHTHTRFYIALEKCEIVSLT